MVPEALTPHCEIKSNAKAFHVTSITGVTAVLHISGEYGSDWVSVKRKIK